MSSLDDTYTGGFLKCPLCLETYSRPRTIHACKHSFCSECLQSYVCSEFKKGQVDGKYTCPVCPSTFDGPKSTDHAEKWVKLVSLNYPLMLLLQKGNDKKLLPCEPCDTRGETSAAVYFCKGCNEAHCGKCNSVHKSSRATMFHECVEVASNSDLDKAVFGLACLQFCTAHEDKNVEYYCHTHKVFMCSECAIFKHKSCSNVEESSVFSRKVCMELITDEIDGLTHEAKSYLDSLGKVMDNDVEVVSSHINSFKANIATLRQKFNSKLDAYEAKSLEHFNFLRSQKCCARQTALEQGEKIIAAFETDRVILKNIAEHTSNPENAILCHYKMQQLADYKSVMGAKVSFVKSNFNFQFSKESLSILNDDFTVGKFDGSLEEISIKDLGVLSTVETSHSTMSQEKEISAKSPQLERNTECTDAFHEYKLNEKVENEMLKTQIMENLQAGGENMASDCPGNIDSATNISKNRGRSNSRRRRNKKTSAVLSSN